MANWYVSSASWSAVSAWAASTAYTVGQYVRQNATPTVGNERVFRVTTAGTSGTTEPTWTLTKNGTTTDGTVTWTECTGQEAYQAPGAWRPFARLIALNSGFSAAGDTIYVGSAHAETQAASWTFSPPSSATAPVSVICVDETASGSVPPISANLRTSASVTTTGGNQLGYSGAFAETYGIMLQCGSGANGPNLIIANNQGNTARMTNCSLALLGTGGSALIIGNSGSGGLVDLENTTINFSSASQCITGLANLTWRGTSSAVQGTTVPNSLLGSGGYCGQFFLDGVDLSALGTGKSIANASSANGVRVVLKNCRLGSGVTVASNLGSPAYTPTDVINCDSGGAYYRNERYRGQGALTTDPVVTRTGGASDGGTAISHKIVSTTQAFWALPFEAFPVAIYNGTTGSTVTVTVCGIYNGAALPTNDQVWLQVSYLGSATSPLATIKNATKGDVLATGSALTADTSAWDANVAARANSTAYTVGQTIKTASNPGRVFFCTAAGTSASSEPAGYASAVDGGSVTDGTATFRAGVRFKQSVPLSSPTPQAAGLITVTPKVGLPSATFYVDPLVTLS